MAVSFKEKRELLKEIDSCFGELENNPDFKTKRALLKRIDDAFLKLDEKVSPAETSILDRLLAGEFTKEEPVEMFRIIRDALKLANGAVDVIKDAIRKFLDWHDAQGHNMMAGAVMESAMLPYSFSNDQAISQLVAMLRSGRRGSFTITLD